MVKIVLVATSAGDLKGHPTGLWVEELAAPYYIFKEHGYEVVIASPKGGPCPIDIASMAPGMFTEPSKKFMHDGEAVGALSHSVKLADIDWSTVDSIFLMGGHGTCVDFVDQPSLAKGIETLYAAGKLVGAVCHGPTGLVNCKKPDGTPLVAGKMVAGFSDTEEEAVQLTKNVPFLLEAKLKELGGKYEKLGDWQSKVCVDGNLVTGQNPQSSEEAAREMVKILG
jgi:putative intracellular protease/amidase